MVNQEHLQLLQQGTTIWNAWREHHPNVRPDFGETNLRDLNLDKADPIDRGSLFYDDLSRPGLDTINFRWLDDLPDYYHIVSADLHGANLNGANLRYALLQGASLRGANLSHADLTNTELCDADLSHADLSHADLSGANLNMIYTVATIYRPNLSAAGRPSWTVMRIGADLTGADLTGARLIGADLTGANLTGANFNEARVGFTNFGFTNLKSTKGLETVHHSMASTIGIDTIMQSEGDIPEVFLRGAGMSDTFITYIRSLVGKPIEYYSCFISHSSKDQEFVERLYADLQSKGVRCWLAPEDLKTGDKIRDRIDQSIRLYDKLLLVLSEHYVNSAWVEFEVEAAIAKENSKNTLMLFPIRLDSAVKDSPTSWAAHIRRTRHITDFSKWKQHDAYQKVLKRLLRDLKPEIPPVAEQG